MRRMHSFHAECRRACILRLSRGGKHDLSLHAHRTRSSRDRSALGLAGVSTGATPAEDAASPNPQAIVARAFQNLYGFTSVQRVEIRARRGDGREYLRSVQVARRGASDGLNRMLVRFLGPGDLRGIGLLLMERPDFSYDAFLYQPALARVRRVSVAQRADAFFGTDVFFEDLEGKRSAQWRARLLRAETVAGRPALVIELQPDRDPERLRPRHRLVRPRAPADAARRVLPRAARR